MLLSQDTNFFNSGKDSWDRRDLEENILFPPRFGGLYLQITSGIVYEAAAFSVVSSVKKDFEFRRITV